MKLTRRRLLPLLPLLPAGLLAPRLIRASASSDRRFLFIFCEGGWDVSMVFSPVLGVAGIDAEEGLVLSEAGGIPFGDHEDRPEVRSFFETHGSRCCVINGLEVRSIVHDKCDQLIMTGQTGAADDWGSLLAGHSSVDYLLPYLHISGPLYTTTHTSSVVRLGENNQLTDLLTGDALASSDMPVSPLPLAPDPAEAFLSERAAMLSEQYGGQASQWMTAFGQTSDRLTDLRTALGENSLLDLKTGSDFEDQLELAVRALETGTCRCTLVQQSGLFGLGWDTHSLNSLQSLYFADLFTSLDSLITTLSETPGDTSASLLDEVCVVVFSEMGRHPILNNREGRDHWTYTSALLIGAGVAGGQAIGGLDDGFIGQSIDLSSGDQAEAGTALQAGHLGATLLALGDVDPGEVLPDFEPVTAALS